MVFTTVSKIGTDKDVCPTCLKPIDKTHVDHIKHKKEEYRKEIKDREDEIKNFEAKIFDLTSLKTKIQDAIKKGQNNINQSTLS